ncbi:uncharacterized protein DDB_G0290685-like [Nilaparvata lugens]|uniref:uncharacterized protein DDB_G0290685-like n=1 Tax=Nilaparvata lugens TaxID=108931 RepID=UPI00193D61B2|nr:uncharacterized protein DDB_G0290685-like [Nilaparvata lugens]
MDGGRNSKDRTRRGDDEGRSKEDGEVREEGDGVPENNEVEQSQLASDVNEQEYVDGSQEHSLISEIEKSRRINLDETGTTHIAKISEGKRSHRKVDYDDSNNEQSSSKSRKYDKGKHSKSKKNTPQTQRPLLTYSTEFVEEVYESEIEDPETKVSNIKDDQINSIRDNDDDDDDDDPLIYNAEEKPSVNSVNTDVSNGNHGKHSNYDEDEKNQHGLSESRELFFNPHQVRMSLPSSRDFTSRNQSETGQRMSTNTDHDTSNTDRIFRRAGEEIPKDYENNALDDQFEEESYGSESITLTNSHHERRKPSGSGKGILLNPIEKGVNKTSSFTSSKYSGDAHDEDTRSVMNQIVSDQQPQENHDGIEKQIDPESDILDKHKDRGENLLVNPVGDRESNSELRLISPETKPYTKDSEEIMDNPSDSDSKRKQDKHFDGDEVNTSDDLGNDSWSPQSELNNNSWNAKTEQRHNKGEKETSDNPHEQRGSLLNSRSFSPNQYIEDGEENTCGPDQCGLNFDPGQNFNDKEDEDETSLNKEIMSQHSPSRRESAVTFDEGKRKDYNEGRPSKNLTLNGSDGNTMVQSSSPQKMKVFDLIT